VTETERESDRETEKPSKSWGDYATVTREQHDVSKPIEMKYFKFDC